MQRFISTVAVCGLMGFAVIGCDQKSQVKEQTKITTPGGTTTKTVTEEVKKSGDHKDDVPADAKPATTP